MYGNTFLIYVQSRMSQDCIDAGITIRKDDTEDMMGRKSYFQKIQDAMLRARKCELSPLINGYKETKSWQIDRYILTLHGNIGCGDWFRESADIS